MKKDSEGKMDKESILALANSRSDHRIGRKIKYYEQTDSTNNQALLAAQAGEAEAVFVAKMQSAGRGRGDHTFFSPIGGLYFSVLLRAENIDVQSATIRAAAAVHAAIARLTGLSPRIKWVNDIFCEGKKICGILAQAVYAEGIAQSIILGIGVNVETTDFPPELAEYVSSLTLLSDRQISCETMLNGILDELERAFYDESVREIVNYYEAHCLYIGQLIKYISGGISGLGRAVGVSEAGALIIDVGGSRVELLNGEIQICSNETLS